MDIVDVGAAKAPSTQHAEIWRNLAEWIFAKGAGLESEEQSGPDGKCDINSCDVLGLKVRLAAISSFTLSRF
jgi:hypothetical protein